MGAFECANICWLHHKKNQGQKSTGIFFEMTTNSNVVGNCRANTIRCVLGSFFFGFLSLPRKQSHT